MEIANRRHSKPHLKPHIPLATRILQRGSWNLDESECVHSHIRGLSSNFTVSSESELIRESGAQSLPFT